jgi:hypothetical protein
VREAFNEIDVRARRAGLCISYDGFGKAGLLFAKHEQFLGNIAHATVTTVFVDPERDISSRRLLYAIDLDAPILCEREASRLRSRREEAYRGLGREVLPVAPANRFHCAN